MNKRLIIIIVIINIVFVMFSCDAAEPGPSKLPGSPINLYALDFDDFQNGIFFSRNQTSINGRRTNENKKLDTSLDFCLDYYFNKNFLDKYDFSFSFNNYDKTNNRTNHSNDLYLHFEIASCDYKIICYPYEKLEFSPIPVVHTKDSIYYNNNSIQADTSKMQTYLTSQPDFYNSYLYSDNSYFFNTNGIMLTLSLLGELESGYGNAVPNCLFPSKVKYIDGLNYIFVDDNDNEYKVNSLYNSFRWPVIDRSGLSDSLIVNCNIKLNGERIYCSMFLNIFPELIGIDLTEKGEVYYELEKNIHKFTSYKDRIDGETTNRSVYYPLEEYKIKIFEKYNDKDFLINQISFLYYDDETNYKYLYDENWDLHTLRKLAKYENLLEEYGRTFKENMYKLSFTDEIVRKSMTQSVVF